MTCHAGTACHFASKLPSWTGKQLHNLKDCKLIKFVISIVSHYASNVLPCPKCRLKFNVEFKLKFKLLKFKLLKFKLLNRL